MSKFNTAATVKTAPAGPVVTATEPAGATFEGAPGYARDAKGELFLLAVSNMVGEQTFYETGKDRDARYTALVRQVALEDPAWAGRFLCWLRGEGNMRSASLVGAAEFVKARLDAGVEAPVFSPVRTMKPGDVVPNPLDFWVSSRSVVNSVLQRADEPGEMLAYWTGTYGRAVPKPVKRGVADAARRLYTERALLKYDTASHAFRFADVIDLCHPAPATPAQGDLFAYALDRRHNRETVFEVDSRLTMLRRNAELRAETDPEAWLNPDRLKAAGMTWEDALSAVGSKVDKATLWAALAPSMGYMALLRNLRNFDQAGVDGQTAAAVAARLADPEQVARSRQFPFRFLAAYRAAPSLRWGHALDTALTASLGNVPELPGRSLVLVDRSGSMFGRMSVRSELTAADAAAVFGSALALRNPGRVDLVEFGTGSRPVQVQAGGSLLKTVEKFTEMGGTETAGAVRTHYNGHDRVLIVTDEQAWAGWGDPGSAVPADKPVYTWNLLGYRHGHGPGAPLRYTFGGLTDAAFRMVPLLEAGRNADWPF